MKTFRVVHRLRISELADIEFPTLEAAKQYIKDNPACSFTVWQWVMAEFVDLEVDYVIQDCDEDGQRRSIQFVENGCKWDERIDPEAFAAKVEAAKNYVGDTH